MAFMFGMVYFGVLSWLRYYPFQKKNNKKSPDIPVCVVFQTDVPRLMSKG